MVKWIPQAIWLFTAFLTNGIDSYFCKYHVCLTWTISETELSLKCRVSNLHFRVEIIEPSNKLIGECHPAQTKSNCDTYSNNAVIAQNVTTNETTCLIRGTVNERMNGKWKCLHGTNKGFANVDVTVLRYKDEKCRVMLWPVIGYFGAISLWLTFLSFMPTQLNCVEGLYRRVFCKIMTKTRQNAGFNKCKKMPITRLIAACKGIAFLVLTVLILLLFWIHSKSTDNSCKKQYVYFAIASLCGLLIGILFLNKEDVKEKQRDVETQQLSLDELENISENDTEREEPSQPMQDRRDIESIPENDVHERDVKERQRDVETQQPSLDELENISENDTQRRKWEPSQPTQDRRDIESLPENDVHERETEAEYLLTSA